jgi:alanine racemase
MDPRRTRTWAEIDLRALHHNLAVVRNHAPNADVLAVVKANAYGHGLTKVCQSLASSVAYFGVAAISEASIIRNALEGMPSPSILIMGETLAEELPKAISRGWHLSVSSITQCQVVIKAAEALGHQANIHLVADTGMGRMGALPADFKALCQHAQAQPVLNVRGLSTHLSSADEDESYTQQQLKEFDQLLNEALAVWSGEDKPLVHVLNSAGIFRKGQTEQRTLVRPGLMLYGCSPETPFQSTLKPVMTVKSRIRLIRELPTGSGISYGHSYITTSPTLVATIGIGYGDGFSRALAHRATTVLIQGQHCSLLGQVTMDQIMVDVTHLQEQATVGDEVVILGSQGGKTIDLRELATKARTIPWEVLTEISGRVCRIHLD